jgi:inorganic pyrophosphatase/exopolyphosphatase
LKIVTAGFTYTDIDAYAGSIAYAELLRAQGFEAQAVSTAPTNESVSKTVRSWNGEITDNYTPSDEDTYALIDISDPEWFEKFVDLDRIDEVIDHRPGFEEYWKERIGERTIIEFLGSACTQVYEKWKESGLLDQMSITSARLLVCGILDNTLNLKAKVTTPRDHEAYDDLLSRADLPEDWSAQYFTEVQEAILADAVKAVQNDTKMLNFKTFDKTLCVGQFAVWDGHIALERHQDALSGALSDMHPQWFMNLISVGEGKSYFVSSDDDVKEWLSNLLGISFEGNVATADRMWLRKEMLKQDIEAVTNQEGTA